MKNQTKKRIRKAGVLLVVLTLMLQMATVPASAALQTAAESNVVNVVSAPSNGCVLVGIQGEFVMDADAALKRINEIRLEACREGVQYPGNPGRRLTEADYVPIKWSSDLEYIARVRAAEASLVISHTRPNGRSCFTVKSPNGVSSIGEILAWNYSKSAMQGIEQWYEEKRDWVNQNSGAVTGHYTQMIDPTNTYVGLGCFLNSNGVYLNSTSGEFLGGSGRNTAQSPGVADCMVVTDIQQKALSAPVLKQIDPKAGSSTLVIGNTYQYGLLLQSTLEGDKARVWDRGKITWSSSDPATASVDSQGQVKMNSAGTAVITASSNSGMKASIELSSVKKPSPKAVSGLTLKAVSKGFTAKWKKPSGKLTGYQLQYAAKSGFASAKNVWVKKSSTVKKTVKKLSANKTYYVRIRSYQTLDGKKYYSAWSKSVKVKTKR